MMAFSVKFSATVLVAYAHLRSGGESVFSSIAADGSVDQLIQARTADVGVYLVSCGRLEELRKTISSFEAFLGHSHSIGPKLILEDSEDEKVVAQLKADYPAWTVLESGLPRSLKREERIMANQAKAAEWVLEQSHVSYIVHLEDDWEFQREGFLSAAIEVLDADVEAGCCSGRKANPQRRCPTVKGISTVTFGSSNVPFVKRLTKSAYRCWSGDSEFAGNEHDDDWGGWTNNAGVMTADFARKVYIPTCRGQGKNTMTERLVSRAIHELSYTIFVPLNSFVEHIGDGKHVSIHDAWRQPKSTDQSHESASGMRVNNYSHAKELMRLTWSIPGTLIISSCVDTSMRRLKRREKM